MEEVAEHSGLPNGDASSSSGAVTGASSSSSTPSVTVTKSGVQLLQELLAIAFQVFEEAKHINLKPPLQPGSRLFTVDPLPSASPAPADATSNETDHAVNANPGLAPVIPFTHDEIQDSFTKIATLKNLYIKTSLELAESIKQMKQQEANKPEDKEAIEKLIQRRNQLRKEVYERNVVMKGLIDRLRHLQHTIRFLRGGSAYQTPIVMESV